MILCSALKLHDELEPDIILPCYRHSDGYIILKDLDINYKDFKIIQGFLTSSGDFLDRKEAYTEALRCGQLSAEDRHRKSLKDEIELYSEDLY